MKFDQVRAFYGVEYYSGQRVFAYGKPGTVVKDFGHRIGIRLDEGGPSGKVGTCHPIDGIEPMRF